MNPEQLIDAATAETDLDDFGAPSFRDGLDVLVGALNDEAQLNGIGEAAAESMVTGALASRLRITDWWNRHPEIADEKIDSPIFIVGVSRSGTTALSHLLANDPANRSLLAWETSNLVPPPGPDTYAADTRRAAALEAESENMLHVLNPGFKAMHHDPTDMPIECVTLMAHDFVSLQFSATFNMKTYADWILARDHRPTYEYHRRVLQLLQSGGVRGRWQLKTPHHGLAVETIAEVYPDARFVWTHRDPAICIASTASITTALSGTFSDAEWAHFEGRLWPRILGEMIERTGAARDRLGDHRFVDVSYTQLVADPVGAVTRLYNDLGEEISSPLDTALRAHATEHRQHRHGRHEYTFERFGLDQDALDERFTDYRSRYEL